MGTAPYTAGETIDADDAGVVALGQRASDNTFQILPIEPPPSLNSIALGQVTGWSVIDKFGKNEAVGSAFEDVWPLGGTMSLLSAAEIMEISSDDANDTDGGSGAHSVELHGLDANYNEIDEQVTLNGTSTVTSTIPFLRVTRVHIHEVGATLSNEGNITVTAQTAATNQAYILIDEGQSQQAMFTIPANKTGYFDEIFFTVGTNTTMSGQLQVRPFGEGWQTKREIVRDTGDTTQNMAGSEIIPEKSDVRWRAGGAAGNNVVTAGFKILLEDLT